MSETDRDSFTVELPSCLYHQPGQQVDPLAGIENLLQEVADAYAAALEHAKTTEPEGPEYEVPLPPLADGDDGEGEFSLPFVDSGGDGKDLEQIFADLGLGGNSEEGYVPMSEPSSEGDPNKNGS